MTLLIAFFWSTFRPALSNPANSGKFGAKAGGTPSTINLLSFPTWNKSFSIMATRLLRTIAIPLLNSSLSSR
ncbi:hypothetical protein BDV19DRAFT_370743 [Aspergillus venezuelensis]